MNCDINDEINKTILNKELKKKIAGYKGQDNKKHIYDDDNFITLERVYEKLIESKHKCYYCKCDVKIIYNNNREPLQWTLDRIDNNLGHNYDNCVICCLKCNLVQKSFKF